MARAKKCRCARRWRAIYLKDIEIIDRANNRRAVIHGYEPMPMPDAPDFSTIGEISMITYYERADAGLDALMKPTEWMIAASNPTKDYPFGGAEMFCDMICAAKDGK